MQIVIDIDDNLYTRLFDNGENYVADMRRACVAIRNGTVLPKRHGDLIDLEEVRDRYVNIIKVSNSELESLRMLAEILDTSPIIIEADKAESEVGK